MAITTHALSKHYGTQKALDQVTLDLPKGQIVGLLGPNGAGKSTLMKILTGYIPASEGSAMVCGLDCAKDSLAVRQKVGYLPEHNPLYLDMYVTEFIRFVANLYGAPEEAVEQRIAEVGLTPERHKQITLQRLPPAGGPGCGPRARPRGTHFGRTHDRPRPKSIGGNSEAHPTCRSEQNSVAFHPHHARGGSTL